MKNRLLILSLLILSYVPLRAQEEIIFSGALRDNVTLNATEINAQSFAVLRRGSSIVVRNIDDPDHFVFDCILSTSPETQLILKKKVQNLSSVLNSLLITRNPVITSYSHELLLPEKRVELTFGVPDDFSGELLVKSIRIYSMDPQVAENKRLQGVFSQFSVSNEIKNTNAQITDLKRIINKNFMNIHDVYHKQNHLLVELKIAEFINAKNMMSNPMTYDKFKESMKYLEDNTTDSVNYLLLKNYKDKLQESTSSKAASTVSSILSIGGSIINGFTGGALSGVFNGIKALAASVISSRTKMMFENGVATDVKSVAESDFLKKYNTGYKNFKVMNVMLDNLERDQQSMNDKIERIRMTALDLERQQVKLKYFASEYYSSLGLKFSEANFTRLAKLTAADLADSLATKKVKVDDFLGKQVIVATESVDIQGQKKQVIHAVLVKNADATVYNSNYYDNSAVIFGIFLDFAADLMSEKLISDQQAVGLDPAYVLSVNTQYQQERNRTIQKYCALMTTINSTLIAPNDITSRSENARKLCPQLAFSNSGQ